MHNLHRRSIKLSRPFPGQEPVCTADPNSAIPSAVALGQKGRTLFMGFPLSSPCGKSGLAPLYPHHWVYLKEPKPPLNKFVEISATAGRFCSRRHLVIRSVFPVCDCILPSPYGFFPAKKLRALFIVEPPAGFEPAPSAWEANILRFRRRRHLVTPAGFEPAITGLRILRPDQLDEGAIWRPERDLNPQPPERQSGYSTIELSGHKQSTVFRFFPVSSPFRRSGHGDRCWT